MMQHIGLSGDFLTMSKGIQQQRSKPYDGNKNADFSELTQTALKARNQEALASLAHADMQMAVNAAKQHGGKEAVDQLVASMTRGPGENLLLQWFLHRHLLPPEVKKMVRELAKKALIEVAMNWPSAQIGGGEQGWIHYALSSQFDLLAFSCTRRKMCVWSMPASCSTLACAMI